MATLPWRNSLFYILYRSQKFTNKSPFTTLCIHVGHFSLNSMQNLSMSYLQYKRLFTFIKSKSMHTLDISWHW